MRKIFLPVMLVIVFLTTVHVYSIEEPKHQAYLSDASVYLDYKKQFCLNPVVMVNGHTYVSLRDVCEKIGANFEWNEDESIISVEHDLDESGKFENVNDIKSLFNMFFKTEFPESAEILHYDFGYLGEAYFRIKLAVNKSDVDKMKENIDFVSVSDLSKDTIDEEKKTLEYFSNNSSWWDLTELDKNALYAIAPNYQGFHARSVTAKIFIVEYSGNECCLYAYYY